MGITLWAVNRGAYRNEYMSSFPVIAGHEFGGTVVEVGKAVTDFEVGERVAKVQIQPGPLAANAA